VRVDDEHIRADHVGSSIHEWIVGSYFDSCPKAKPSNANMMEASATRRGLMSSREYNEPVDDAF
jgi:hypothetical protein